MQETVTQQPWLRIWMLSALLTLAGLGIWEWHWRERGFVPEPSDDQALWAQHRSDLDEAGCRGVALLGASRLLLGFDLPTAAGLQPDWTFVQLGVNGHFPLATLEDLAAEGFCGVAVVSLLAQAFEPGYTWDMQQPWVDHFHQRTPSQRLDRWLRSLLEPYAVLLHSERSLWRALRQWRRSGQWPLPPYHRMAFDRSIAADYQHTDNASLAANFVKGHRETLQQNPPSSPAIWFRMASNIARAVRHIEGRGGRVVFVRFPTKEGHWQTDQEYYPRQHYWDRLSEASGALTLHFQDLPGMADFALPDTSHLDHRDAPAFTTLLVNGLAERGLFERGQVRPSPAP